jgi:IS5 family transposase
LDLESGGLDQSNFSRLRERLVETDIARRFFDEVVRLARKDKLLSSDHFTVDGTLIDAWASFKSFKRKDDDEPPKPGDGTGMVDFKGEKRSNATHQSTTDPDAKLMRKGNGQPAKLSYGGHALMENRSGLCVDLLITDATLAEHQAARQLLTRARRRKIHPKTLGADKGYHVKDFVQHLREHGIKPHIARIDGRKTPGLDGRTSCTEGYKNGPDLSIQPIDLFGAPLRRKGWPCACFKYRRDHKCLKAVSDMVCVLQSRATSRPPRHRRAPLKPYSERNGIAPA